MKNEMIKAVKNMVKETKIEALQEELLDIAKYINRLGDSDFDDDVFSFIESRLMIAYGAPERYNQGDYDRISGWAERLHGIWQGHLHGY